jgi:uncharacterized protein (DUF1697 family)
MKTTPPKAAKGAVALLRGINVGGKNLLPMKELAALFAECGSADVATYIQSGNVVFRAALAGAALETKLERAIADRFGFEVPVVVRSAAELRAISKQNPFLPARDVGELHVAFLKHAPAPERVAALDHRRSPPDEFEVVAREIYLRCPNGVARTKLTNAYFDRALATISTARNWRTVLKLVDMVGELDRA